VGTPIKFTSKDFAKAKREEDEARENICDNAEMIEKVRQSD